MQDRYAADIGDFGKYGLLRFLCKKDKYGPALRLGVLWYRFTGREPGAPNDGKHIDYLCSQKSECCKKCDPELFAMMRKVVQGERSVAAVEQCGALPSNTLYFSDPLIFKQGERRPERAQKRREWLAAGLRKVKPAALVFADPDNGFEVKSVKPLTKKDPKYVYYEDLLPCWNRGQSLVVYQHSAQNKSVEKQTAERIEGLRKRFSGLREVILLRYHRGTSRVFFVLPNPAHAERLKVRCHVFIQSPWGQHFTIMPRLW